MALNLRWSALDRCTDAGLLIIRAGVGALFLFHHGWPRLLGGRESWADVGRAMGYLDIKFGYPVWGLLALLAETLGGLCLILGFAHRPAALALALTMAVAAIWEFYPFGGYEAAAHPLALLFVCTGLIFTGPGKLSLEAVWK